MAHEARAGSAIRPASLTDSVAARHVRQARHGSAIRSGGGSIVHLIRAGGFRLISGLGSSGSSRQRRSPCVEHEDGCSGNSRTAAGAHARRYGKKASRFLIVSAFNVVFGQSLLVLTHSWLGWSFAVSNGAAVAIGAGPAYVLTRYWVWEKRSKNHLVKEVLPFWGLAFFGLIVSTVATGIANTYTDAQVVLNLVNLASFGLIWVFKFFLFDRFMFGGHHHALEPAL